MIDFNFKEILLNQQIISIICCVIISVLSVKITNLIPLSFFQKYLSISITNKVLKKNLNCVVFTLFLWLSLSICIGIFELTKINYSIVLAASKFMTYATLLLFLYYMYAAYNKIRLFTFFVLFLLVVSFAVSALDSNELIVNVLSKYSITIEHSKITILFLYKHLVIICLALWIAKTLVLFLKEYFSSIKRIDQNTRTLLNKTSQIIIYFLTILIAMNNLGINLTSLTVISGAIGVGIGIGLQKISANFISGLTLLIEKTIKAGDLIELPNSVIGRVKRLASRYTLLETYDGKSIIIPNANLVTDSITNLTLNGKNYRLNIKLNITFESDYEKALSIMLDASKQNLHHDIKHESVAYIIDITTQGYLLGLDFWIQNVFVDTNIIRGEILDEIIKKFNINKIVFTHE